MLKTIPSLIHGDICHAPLCKTTERITYVAMDSYLLHQKGQVGVRGDVGQCVSERDNNFCNKMICELGNDMRQ